MDNILISIILVIIIISLVGYSEHSSYEYIHTEGNLTDIHWVENRFLSPAMCMVDIDRKERTISGDVCLELEVGEMLCECERSWGGFGDIGYKHCKDCERGGT